MDELLSLMEDDLEGGVEDIEYDPRIPDPSCRRMTLSPLKTHNRTGSSGSSPSQQSVTFKDIFGSPDKRDVKDLGLSTEPSSSPSPFQNPGKRKLELSMPGSSSSTHTQSSLKHSSFPSTSQLQLRKAIREDDKVPYKAESSLSVIDPYSRIRILKSSISIYFDETMTPEAALKDRNLGMEFVDLSSFSAWYRGKGKDQKMFWVSGVLVRKTAGVRKSAKGNDYSIWELCDLKNLDKKVTVFFFGSASSSSSILSSTPLGSLVDITTPSVMQDTSGNGTIKLTVNNSSQVRLIAQAKDFGYCQATKKDGNKCTAVVNTWECSFCIHHASAELKRLNFTSGGKGKGRSKSLGNRSKSFGSVNGSEEFGGGESRKSLEQQRVFIADFGGTGALKTTKNSCGGRISLSQDVKITSRPSLPPSSRMALQGGVNQMGKNPAKFGNADTIKFISKGGEKHSLLKQEGAPPQVVRKSLDLNPSKTRHLTDKDRELLSILESKAVTAGGQSPQDVTKNAKAKTEHVVSDLITSSIVSNPGAASRNFMQYLSLQHAPKDQVDLNSASKSSAIQPLSMSMTKVRNMKKALDFVKKNGPIKKAEPNGTSSGTKRKLKQSLSALEFCSSSSKKRHVDVEFDFESDDFKNILNAKSAHDEELEEIQHEEYFGKLEKKEALENKLLNTFSIETNAVMCRQCKYVALSQSEFCKDQLHHVRLVKARKRFFKCKDCGNRTMSLDRLPKRPCSNCNNSSWLVAPVGKERRGPTLPSEMLSVRGNEEKFIGSAGAKMFLHLDV